VIVTHGSIPVMVRWLCQIGLDAAGFDTEFGDEDDESAAGAPVGTPATEAQAAGSESAEAAAAAAPDDGARDA
jgi:putative mRNA 3-end processing factor